MAALDWLVALPEGVKAAGYVAATLVLVYFKGRVSEQSKIDTIEKNIERVLRQQEQQARAVESVKADVSGGLWVEQERWRLKKEVYVTLVEAQASLRAGISAAIRPPCPPERPASVEEALRSYRDRKDVMDANARAVMALPSFALSALGEVDRVFRLLVRLEESGWSASPRAKSALFSGYWKELRIACERFARLAGEDLQAFTSEDRKAFEAEQRRRAELAMMEEELEQRQLEEMREADGTAEAERRARDEIEAEEASRPSKNQPEPRGNPEP